MTAIARAAHWRTLRFLAWAAVGAGLGLGVAGILTIGVFVLPATLVVMAALIRLDGAGGARGAAGTRRAWRARGAGMLSGLGSVPLYLAYLNRGGPGTVCHAISGGQKCAQMWSPWPFLAAALLLVGAGAALYLWRPGR